MMACLEMMMLLLGAAIGCAVALVVLWVKERAERRRRARYVRVYFPPVKALTKLTEGIKPDGNSLEYARIAVDQHLINMSKKIARCVVWPGFAAAEAKQGYPAFGFCGVNKFYNAYDSDDNIYYVVPVRCTVTEAGIKYIDE
jgi:cytochrome c-type biogenesis protein CcmH/NrfG